MNDLYLKYKVNDIVHFQRIPPAAFDRPVPADALQWPLTVVRVGGENRSFDYEVKTPSGNYFNYFFVTQDQIGRTPVQAPEGANKFSKDDRERIKGHSMLPTDTLRYIEALEQIARAALKVLKNTPHPKQTALTRESLNDLNDALSVVNFMR